MRPRVLWVLGFVGISLAAMGAAAVLAWRAGYLNGVAMQLKPPAGEAVQDGRLIVQLYAQIDNPREPSRTHQCEFRAMIQNRTPYHLLAAHIVLGSRTIDLPEIRIAHSADMFVWTVAVPQEQADCAQAARRFQKIAYEARATSCAMNGATQAQCQDMVRVVGDFDYPHLQADDWEAARAAAAAADALRQANLPVGTVVEIAPDSFFKLGFDRGDVQISDAARALASAEQPFDPDNPVDTNRLYLAARYASMDGPVTVLAVHEDKDGVADWYKVSLWADPGDAPRYQVIAWVPRDDLDKARKN